MVVPSWSTKMVVPSWSTKMVVPSWSTKWWFHHGRQKDPSSFSRIHLKLLLMFGY